MEKVNVLVLAPVGEKCLKQIAEISPLINVIDGVNLLGIQNPFEQFGRDSVVWEKLTALLKDTEVLFTFRSVPDLTTLAPHLKWMQILSAGVDRVLTPDLIESQVILTNVKGMHAVQISEMVFNLMLMHAKKSLYCLQNQGKKQWVHFTPELLSGKTVGIVGYGSIGRRIAQLSRAFGMRVIATRRRVKGISRARNVDVLYPRKQVGQLLSESDYVVDALPSTPETQGFFNEAAFRQMKPSAFFINIGRGATVDEAALIKALQEKWIAGAGLDTFVREPLPPDSPLWEMENVIITPHIAGAAPDYLEKATGIFCENLRRYLSGRRLINVVDKKAGY